MKPNSSIKAIPSPTSRQKWMGIAAGAALIVAADASAAGKSDGVVQVAAIDARTPRVTYAGSHPDGSAKGPASDKTRSKAGAPSFWTEYLAKSFADSH